MNPNEQARWQHLVIFLCFTGLLCGMMMFVIPLASHAPKAAPWWVGAMVFTVSMIVGRLAFASLGRAKRDAAARALAESGVFRLPDNAPAGIARLNADLIEQFGIGATDEEIEPSQVLPYASKLGVPKPPLPATFGALATAIHERASRQTWLGPSQHTKARDALARATNRPPESIRFSEPLVTAIPAGRERFAVWEQLRAAGGLLPDATMNPWIENLAFYVFLAALIAIAVPIAQRLDANPETRTENPSMSTRLFGKVGGLVLFGVIIAVLMVPVHRVSRKFTCRLPENVRTVGSLGQYFPQADGKLAMWTLPQVEAHLRDLAAAALGRKPAEISAETRLV